MRWSIPTVVLLAATLAACGQGQPPPGDSHKAVALEGQEGVALEDLKGVIASSAGYPKDAIELLANPVHLRVAINDDKLAHSNQMDRENAATTIVSAAEQAMTAHPQFAAVQVISVAIVHTAPRAAPGSGYSEDVLEFRKGPDQRFSHHVT